MREGVNPVKENPSLRAYGIHRAVLPVYIPDQEGYYRYSLDVLRCCLSSLWHTSRGQVAVTVVANGCCSSVLSKLREWEEYGWIDQLVINRFNRGKVDSVVGAVKGVFEPLVTVSDADILFLPGWLEETWDIFKRFPEVGCVSPLALPHLHWHYTSSVVVGALARRELGYRKVLDDKDIDRFAMSTGNSAFCKPEMKVAQLVVTRGGKVVAVGATHCVFTMRRELTACLPDTPALLGLGKVNECLDMPLDRAGAWRVSTVPSYAAHIGNVPDAWVLSELEKMAAAPAIPEGASLAFPRLRRHWTSRIPYRLRQRIAGCVRRAVLWKRQRLMRTWSQGEGPRM
jgi:hypothetical protein